MAWGPGKYDVLCNDAMLKANAKCALVIILGGNQGNGFSMQTCDMKIVEELPIILRSVADQIEKDAAESD